MKTVILVNGVPASGKSTVARQVSQTLHAPLLALDTVKEAFFEHLGTGDRLYNRTLGRGSYQAIFALIGAFPEGSVAVVDAWFGFQPLEVLQGHLVRGGVTHTAEVWCHAPPQEIGRRYEARLGERSSGHLGADYVPELIELAGRAKPLSIGPLYEVDTTRPLDAGALADWLRTAVPGTP